MMVRGEPSSVGRRLTGGREMMQSACSVQCAPGREQCGIL